MTHSFDVVVARAYGVIGALMIEHFQFWVMRNRANRSHFREGRTWTYDTIKSLHKQYPYATVRQIRYAVDALIEKGVIIKDCFNDQWSDQTRWYAFADENKFVPDIEPVGDESDAETQQNRICQNRQLDIGFENEPVTNTPAAETQQNRICQNRQLSVANNVNCSNTGIHTTKGGGNPAPAFEKSGEEKQPVNKRSAASEFCGAAATVQERDQVFFGAIKEFQNEHPDLYPRGFFNEFYDHWRQPNASHTLMKFETIKGGCFGIEYQLKKFWRWATPEEKRTYWHNHNQYLLNKQQPVGDTGISITGDISSLAKQFSMNEV